MAYDDYSTPRVNRFRHHANGDHSECLYIRCPNRKRQQDDGYEFIIESLAAGIPDEIIEQMTRDKFPAWVWEYIGIDDVMRMESRYI